MKALRVVTIDRGFNKLQQGDFILVFEPELLEVLWIENNQSKIHIEQVDFWNLTQAKMGSLSVLDLAAETEEVGI